MMALTDTAPKIERNPDDVPLDRRVRVGEAAAIIGMSSRNVERLVDKGILTGGRPIDPHTGEPIPLSWRWVDAYAAVTYAVGDGRAHLIPENWRHLIQPAIPQPRRT